MPRTPAWLMMASSSATRRACRQTDSRRRLGGEIAALGFIFLGRDGLRRDALVGQHAVDRAPIGVVDIDVLIIIVGFLLRRPADHLADGEDFDFAAELLRRGLDLGDLGGVAGERLARAAVATKNASQLRSAKACPTSDEPAFIISGLRAAVRLRIGARALELQELAVEIERAVAASTPA